MIRSRLPHEIDFIDLVKCQCLKNNHWKQDDFCNI